MRHSNLLHEFTARSRSFVRRYRFCLFSLKCSPAAGMSLPLPSLQFCSFLSCTFLSYNTVPSCLSSLVRRREAGEVCLPLRLKRRKLAYQSSSLMHEKSKRSVVVRVYGVGRGGGVQRGWSGRKAHGMSEYAHMHHMHTFTHIRCSVYGKTLN